MREAAIRVDRVLVQFNYTLEDTSYLWYENLELLDLQQQPHGGVRIPINT